MFFSSETNNEWGIALTNYQYAEFLYFIEQQNIDVEQKQKPTGQRKGSIFTFNSETQFKSIILMHSDYEKAVKKLKQA